MDYDSFARDFPVATQEQKTRAPYQPGQPVSYDTYKGLRGSVARDISVAMDIDDEARIAHNSYNVEMHDGIHHTRLRADGTSQIREVMLFSDKSVIVIDIDKLAGEATQKVYSPNGYVETLVASWDHKAGDYSGTFEHVSLEGNQKKKCEATWQKFESLTARVEQKRVQVPKADM